MRLPESPTGTGPEHHDPLGVIQIGDGNRKVVDNTGVFLSKGVDVQAIDQRNEGDLVATLQGTELMRRLEQEIAAGKDQIILDLQLHPDLSSQQVDSLVALRDRLRRRDVVLKLVGLDEVSLNAVKGKTGDVSKLHRRSTMGKTVDGLAQAA
jgi:hypothetical protein